MPLEPLEVQAVRKILFPEAAAVVLSQKDFPWHRDKEGAVTAAMPQSSQALAISVFGTLKTLAAPANIVDALGAQWRLGAMTGPWHFCLERIVPGTMLGEPRSTQIDASIESDTGLVFFERKFTEPDGGACSQTKPLGGQSRNSGIVQCTGDYVLQTNPVNGKSSRCALTAKGVRYWDVVPRVLSVDSNIDHRPCPFRGGWYQWMRNLAACSVISESSHQRGAFVVLYADGPFPMADKIRSPDWQKFQSLTQGKAVPLLTMSYQELLTLGTAAAPADARVMQRLKNWVEEKIAVVGGAI